MSRLLILQKLLLHNALSYPPNNLLSRFATRVGLLLRLLASAASIRNLVLPFIKPPITLVVSLIGHKRKHIDIESDATSI